MTNCKLETRPDEFTGEPVFEGSLRHPKSSKSAEECIISGFPVLKTTAFACTNCGKHCNKPDWNSYVGVINMCPNCSSIHKVL